MAQRRPADPFDAMLTGRPKSTAPAAENSERRPRTRSSSGTATLPPQRRNTDDEPQASTDEASPEGSTRSTTPRRRTPAGTTRRAPAPRRAPADTATSASPEADQSPATTPDIDPAPTDEVSPSGPAEPAASTVDTAPVRRAVVRRAPRPAPVDASQDAPTVPDPGFPETGDGADFAGDTGTTTDKPSWLARKRAQSDADAAARKRAKAAKKAAKKAGPVDDDTLIADTLVADQPAAEPSRKPKRKSRTDRAEKVAFTETLGGARRGQVIWRWAAGGTVIILAAVGVKTIIAPRTQTISSAAIAEVAQQAAAGTGFPAQTAETMARAFATTYYTWNSERDARAARTAALAQWMPNSVIDGWNGAGVQSIAEGPFVAQSTESTDAHNGVVVLALRTDSGKWLYPRVQVWADDKGAVIVAATPTLGPPPGRADDFPGLTATVDGDIDDTATKPVADMLPGFFTAWAASDGTALSRYVTDTATPQTLQGLGGTVVLGQVSDVRVSEVSNSDGTRTAMATVRWVTGDASQPTTATTTQTYRLLLTQQGQRWSVQHISTGTTGS